ncbi:MAG: hypothetical protein A2091_11230 [Desulfuromonadales bacterium GWD2_61_12]|nr:MAG: hypothetical protein A2005_05355 [Desulfuromonadales bacterium GWC2_61_20]OGR36841.1 MAG: hypothetical protein A2091_11230 [Desulfuromonadales bacterium GWD2_61_12]
MDAKNFFDWCKRHKILLTVAAFLFIVVFGFVNIQILHMTSEPEFCAMCHPSRGFGPLAEVDSWEHSAHGEAGVSCLDCHGRPGVAGYVKAKIGGLKDTYMQFTISKEEKLEILSNPPKDLVPTWHCLFCHSDEGNKKVRETTKGPMKLVNMRMLDDVVNPAFRLNKGLPDILTETTVGGTHFDHKMHIDNFELNCRDCHFGVVHKPSSKTDKMNFCLTCHAENKGSAAPQMNDCHVCHAVQVAMNEGTGAKDVAGSAGIMYAAGIKCTDCHTGVTKGVFRPSGKTCSDCHSGDSGYVEIFQDWEKEVKEKLDILARQRVEVESALKAADAMKRDSKANWELYQKALQNMKFVESDGTFGVHNNDYANAIIKSVTADFTKITKNLEQKW